MFRTLALTVTLALSLTASAACGGGDDASCGKAVDHAAKLMEVEIPADQRKAAIAKCEKEPASKRACAIKAKSVEDLMACK
ncbi:MAG: hypothetical protein HS111_04460 [Kofleriaceae bacterium]|nr:hypothetical protein [Kofleriaceae bacterium]MCL4227836.1 hypothetical protein [Myxococcales bacterium]